MSLPPSAPARSAIRWTASVLRQSAIIAAFCVPAAAAHGQAGSPAGPVPPELLDARRRAVMEALGEGIAIVRSAEARPVGAYAQDSDYREDNDFFYLTGLEAPGGWLVLSPDRAVLYLPERDTGMEAWTGERLGPGPEATSLTGIAEVRDLRQLQRDLAAMRARSPEAPVWSVLARAGARACAGLPVQNGRCAPGLGKIFGELPVLRDLRPVLTSLRGIKDVEEQRRLRRAIDITAEAHHAAAAAIRPGAWEYEVEAAVEYTFRRGGAERVGFPSIIGSGPNSTVLHYDRNRRRMEAGELVVVDIGAEYGYYTADITRTYPVSGRFTARQRALYQLVLGAQQAALEAVKPGATLAELTRIAQEHMRSKSGKLCGEVTCETYFVHGLSHHIGMDVHDAAPPGALKAGMVLTIEPGIYIPAEGLGIRIEDDVLVTAYGYELLSGAAPRRPEQVERLMAEVEGRRKRTTERENH